MEYERLFNRLNEKLKKENLVLDIHCIGGFVLEYYGLKATFDIDAFYHSSDKVEQIIREIGEEFHIGTRTEPWLNQSITDIMSYSAHNDEKIIFSASHLTVSINSLESVLKDKVIAGRSKDEDDIVSILKKLNKRNLKDLYDILEYSDGTTDSSILLDAYLKAFGENALDEYLQEHPEMEQFL